MPDRLDPIERFEFLLGRLAVIAGAFEVAVHEFNRLVHSTRRFDLPDLAVPSAAEPFDEAIARDWLGVSDGLHVHWRGDDRYGLRAQVAVSIPRHPNIVHSGTQGSSL